MSSGVDVWIAAERLLDDVALRGRLSALLSTDELERHDRMAFEAGRRQQLLARALQREVLSRHAPQIAPHEWRFQRSSAGRPSLAPPFDDTGLHFNLAHTRGLAVMAVARAPLVGVDVEALAGRAPLSVAPRYFSPREVAALQALPEQDQPRQFLRLWTLKEAYLKAMGEGLAGGLDSMTFTLGDDAVRFERPEDPQAERWMFREFTPPGFLVALAFHHPGPGVVPQVSVHDYLPLHP
jgi:4'-phosphopantetheinyl transferase